MDISETYIKMCEKAEEIQEVRHDGFEEGDCAYSMNDDGYTWLGSSHDSYKRWEDDIWLPRQDQLQEMIGDFNKCLGMLHDFQCPEVNAYQQEWFEYCQSMEQLWLAFIMHENYNKVWDKENWIDV